MFGIEKDCWLLHALCQDFSSWLVVVKKHKLNEWVTGWFLQSLTHHKRSEKEKKRTWQESRMKDKEQEKNLLPRFTSFLFVSHILIKEEDEEKAPFPSHVFECEKEETSMWHWYSIEDGHQMSVTKTREEKGVNWDQTRIMMYLLSKNTCLVSSSRPLSSFDTLKEITRRLRHSIVSVFRPKITCFITCLLLPTVTDSLRRRISS